MLADGAAAQPILPASEPPPLRLNCLVLGEDRHHVFPVVIEALDTVGTLKKVIKDEKKHTFEHLDADALVLWKVGELVDGTLEEKLLDGGRGLELELGLELDPLALLSEEFPSAPDVKRLHIVIKAPATGACIAPRYHRDGYPFSFCQACHRRRRRQTLISPTPDRVGPRVFRARHPRSKGCQNSLLPINTRKSRPFILIALRRLRQRSPSRYSIASLANSRKIARRTSLRTKITPLCTDSRFPCLNFIATRQNVRRKRGRTWRRMTWIL